MSELLENILSDWNFWSKDPEPSIRREVLDHFPKPVPDIILLDGNVPSPIQVTWEKAQARHFEAYREFKEAYPNSKELQIITYDTGTYSKSVGTASSLNWNRSLLLTRYEFQFQEEN